MLFMKIVSRNVNGIRAVVKKGFVGWVKESQPDILCIQETKAFENQMPPEMRFAMQGYDYVWHEAERPGYAGTATFFKKDLVLVNKISHFEDVEKFSEHGRVLQTKFDLWDYSFVLLNIYFPNGNPRADGTPMLPYKLEFYDHFLYYINTLRDNWENILVTWDYNVAHTEIDIARPKANQKSIWFLPEERAKLDGICDAGYVDLWRNANPDVVDHYTRWSYRSAARARNVWRRLDYFFASEWLLDKVRFISHLDKVMGSDHCPVELVLK